MPSVSMPALYTIYLVVFLDLLFFGMIYPQLPSIAKQFGANAFQMATLPTTFSLGQVIFTPLWGRVSDCVGRRPVLLCTTFLCTASAVMTGVAWNFPLLIVGRLLNGAGAATSGIANAYVADVTTEEERSVYLSYNSAAYSMGMIMGPALGGILSPFGFAITCYVSAALSGINFLVGLVVLAESRSPALVGGEQRRVQNLAARIPWSAYLLYVAGFLMGLGIAAYESITGYYLVDEIFNGNAKVSGQFYAMMFTVAGGTMFVMSAFVYKRILVFCGERCALCFGGVWSTVGWAGFGISPSPIFIMLSTVAMVGGRTTVMPLVSSLLTKICSKEVYGQALGYQQGLAALSRVVAPPVFGAIYDQVSHGVSFYICAVTGLIGVTLVLFVQNRALSSDRRPSETDVDSSMASLETLEG